MCIRDSIRCGRGKCAVFEQRFSVFDINGLTAQVIFAVMMSSSAHGIAYDNARCV